MRRDGWPIGPVPAAAALAILLALSLYSLSRGSLGPGREQGVSSCTVTVEDPGVDCRAIERMITVPLEDAVADIPGVVQVRSVSEYGRSRVTVIAAGGERRAAVTPALRDAVQRVAAGFPSSVRKPEIVASAVGLRPVFVATVRSPHASGDALRDLVEREVKPCFARVDGAGEVDTGGGARQEIHVTVDPAKAARRGLSAADVAGQLARQVQLAPAGRVATGATRTVVSVAGRASSIGGLAALPIRLPAGGSVALGEVAVVGFGPGERQSVSRVDGSEAVVISVHSSGSANLVALSRRLRAEASRWEERGLSFDVLMDRGLAIEGDVRGILSALLQAVAVVAAVLPVFVRQPRRVLALAALLPATGMVAAGTLAALGVSLDQYILCGLAVGIGTILDTGIIVSGQASAARVRAIIPSLAASLATTLIVLVPLLFLDFAAAGIRQVAAAVGLLLVVSFAMDVLLLPAFFLAPAGLPRPRAVTLRHAALRVHRFRRRGIRALHALTRAASRRSAAVLAGGGLLSAGMVAALLLIGKDFSPPVGDQAIYARAEFEPGASMESVDARTLAYVRLLQGRDGIGPIESVARRGGAEIQVRFDPLRTTRHAAVLLMRKAAARIPGGFLYLPDGEGSAGPGMEVSIRGDDDAILRQLAHEAARLLSSSPGVRQVVLNFKEPAPGLAVVVDREQAAAVGLRTADAAAALRWALHGPVALKWIEADREVDVRVMTVPRPPAGRPAIATSRRDVAALPVRAPGGMLVPLGSLARIVARPEAARILRTDRQRTATVTVHPTGGSLEARVRAVRSALQGLRLPPGYAVELDREVRELDRSFRLLWAAFALAAVFVAIVLAGFGESFGAPAAVLAVLPPSLAVPVIAWAALGQPLRVPILVGFIMLSGMVVNNSILVVDAARARLAGPAPAWRAASRSARSAFAASAVRRAVRERIRPLLVTSAVTIAGTIPMLLAPARQGGFMAGLAFVISWGMLGSLAATILVVPAVASAVPALLAGAAAGRN